MKTIANALAITTVIIGIVNFVTGLVVHNNWQMIAGTFQGLLAMAYFVWSEKEAELELLRMKVEYLEQNDKMGSN